MVFHIFVALPLALLIVGYKDSVTTVFSDLIFLPFCMSIGVLVILFSRLYFVHLCQYDESFQAVFYDTLLVMLNDARDVHDSKCDTTPDCPVF